MPQYTFYCKSCNLEFKKRLAMGDHPEHKCPTCTARSPRFLEGFGFDFAVTAATEKANSGVSKHDHPTADNIVGRHAESRWEVMDARNKTKKQLREATGAVALSRRDLTENGQNLSEYTALGTAQFDARKKLEGSFKDIAEKGGFEPLAENLLKSTAICQK